MVETSKPTTCMMEVSNLSSLSKRQKDKKAHDSFEDGNEEKEADQQGKKQKAKAMFS